MAVDAFTQTPQHTPSQPAPDGAAAAQFEPLGHIEQPADADKPRRPGGSKTGRLMWRSRTRAAGIRFEWAMRSFGPVLRVVATWTDQHGHAHHTSFSTECNGLEGALDRAIAARISCGAPMPDREDLLQRLRHEFETSPFARQRATLGLMLT